MKRTTLRSFESGQIVEIAPVTVIEAVINPDNQESLSDTLGRIEESIPTRLSELENDEGFLTSSSSVVTQEEFSEGLSGKVDKVDGKQLSTEDFTTVLKTKLDGLSNYDDAEVNAVIEKLRTDFDTLVGGNTADAIESFNEIVAFLNGVKDSESLDSIIASIEQQIAVKQDSITDLETIRQGASKGATSVQSSDLASVAISGSYDDLSGKPAIPAEVTESTVSGWGFTKNTGTYSKPSTGIPKSDLASDIQTSLGKADTALQSYTEQYKGTVTGVTINGTTKNPSSGVVDLGTVITAHQDISGKQDKVSVVDHGTDDTTFTLTPNVYHKWGTVTSLNLSFATSTDTDTVNYYMAEFVSGTTATTLTLPDTIVWASEVNIEAEKTYQISIFNNLGIIGGF